MLTISVFLVALLFNGGFAFWTTCSIENLGTSATVRCTFSEDLHLTKSASAVVVQRYSLDESDPQADPVVECFWVNGKSRACSVLLEGYQCDGDVSKTLTVSVPHMGNLFAGRYLCYVTLRNQTKELDLNFCVLKPVVGQENTTDETTIQPVSGTSDTKSNETGSASSTVRAIVVSSVLSILGTAMCLVPLFRFTYRRIRNTRTCAQVIKGLSKSVQRSQNAARKHRSLGRREPAGKKRIKEEQGLICELEPKPACHLLVRDDAHVEGENRNLPGAGCPTTQKYNQGEIVVAQIEPSPGQPQFNTKKRSSSRNNKENFRLLLLGKTRSGKSTTGNTILGETHFCPGFSSSSVTPERPRKRSNTMDQEIEIMDSPGLYDTAKSQQELCTTIVQAVACMHPGPHAILLVIRLNDFNKQKEFGCYRRLKALFDDHITNFLIVLFTGGDELERKNQTLADIMKRAPKELNEILEECGNRSIVFNNFAHDPVPQVEQLFELVRKMKEQNGHPYVCPEYMMIEKGLKEEVAKRLAVVEELEMKEKMESKELETDMERNLEVIERGVAGERQAESKQMFEEQDEQGRRNDQNEEVVRITEDRIAENKETGRLIQLIAKPVKAVLKFHADPKS